MNGKTLLFSYYLINAFPCANKWDCGEWCRLLQAAGLCIGHCAPYFFAHYYQKQPWKPRMFSEDPLHQGVLLKDMQGMEECPGAGSRAVSVPQQLLPATTKAWAKWLCDHCAQEGPKGPNERPEMPSQSRSGAGSWFPASLWLQNMTERNRVELWVLCFAGRIVGHLMETALILYLTTPALLKYNVK